MTKIPMTAPGYNRLQDELKRLKTIDRPAVIRAIAEARENGDLSENAEYHAARERQSFIEGRVLELEDKIARAEVIDVSKLSGKIVKFGATVTLADEETDEKAVYQIVGEDEADIAQRRLSVTSRFRYPRLKPRVTSLDWAWKMRCCTCIRAWTDAGTKRSPIATACISLRATRILGSFLLWLRAFPP